MYLSRWKVWIIFIGLAIQPGLYVGITTLKNLSQYQMLNTIVRSMEAGKLDNAVKEAKDGARSPLKVFGVSSVAQLEVRNNEATILAQEASKDMAHWNVTSNFFLLAIFMLECAFALMGGVLIGGLFGKKEKVIDESIRFKS